ncbi:MAG TPA: tyrosine-type recombinase/integrase [Candidatus Bathyarchaeia archaeon]|nr:tyrosine-type recombinase/integrase [Candidatus Bathyarchaeia archaeon]
MPRVVDISEADLEQIRGYQSVQRWLRELEGSTLVNYPRYMVMFKRASSMDPDQFLQWAKTRPDGFDTLDLIVKTAEGFTESNRINYIVAGRSFLTHNGVRNLPKQKLSYTAEDWHRGYRREEIKKLLGYLDSKVHKLYAYIAIETGLRANTILALQYHHVMEDLKAGTVPCAVRFEPKFYRGTKKAGFTFIGKRTVSLLNECIKDKLVDTKPDARLVHLVYSTIVEVVQRAKEKAGIDPKVQPNHGFRKYFEGALDRAELDFDVKRLLEGHFPDARSKSYTDRTWETLRPAYEKAYAFLDVEGSSPEVTTELGNLAEKNIELERQLKEERRRREALEELVPKRLKEHSADLMTMTIEPLADRIDQLEKLVRKLVSKKESK